ncbi:MAG: ATP-binding protein [Actinobacteria bacterium]|jgi:DNA replication protein DnaC|nr:ATP-binding protein [Actinomycetota bacterium]
MDEEFEKMLKYLGLRGLLANWDHYITIAKKGSFSSVRLLKYVIEQEYKIKQENARKRRISLAKIPEPFVIETFPFDRQPKLNKKIILTHYDCLDYMSKQQNMIWIGPTGTGKTGLATAFLTQAINKGYRGKFILFPELVETLYQSLADHSEKKVLKTFAGYDCLLIDEIGLIEIDPVQVGLFFSLMHERHKKKTTLITSNLGFDQWGSFLKNTQLTAALVDRLTENSHVINMKNCKSLRTRLDQQ